MIEPERVPFPQQQPAHESIIDSLRTITDGYLDALEVFDILTMRLLRGESIPQGELLQVRIEAGCMRLAVRAVRQQLAG